MLTCRTAKYDALDEADAFAQDAARIPLRPVDAAEVEAFVQAVAGAHNLPRWQPVLDALTQDGHVPADAPATPWRLTLSTTVYQQRHPGTGQSCATVRSSRSEPASAAESRGLVLDRAAF